LPGQNPVFDGIKILKSGVNNSKNFNESYSK